MNNINKNIIVNTLTPIYDNLEDRIRLSVNYQDLNNRIDVFITRSFILQLLPSIEEYIYKHYPNEVILEDEEIVISNNNPSQTNNAFSQTNQEDFTLYKNIEDLLITVNLSYHNETKLTIITLITKDKYILTLNANAEMLRNIIKALKNSIPKMAWGIAGF